MYSIKWRIFFDNITIIAKGEIGLREEAITNVITIMREAQRAFYNKEEVKLHDAAEHKIENLEKLKKLFLGTIEWRSNDEIEKLKRVIKEIEDIET